MKFQVESGQYPLRQLTAFQEEVSNGVDGVSLRNTDGILKSKDFKRDFRRSRSFRAVDN